MSDLTLLTIAEAARLIEAKQISPVELTKACIAKAEKLQPSLQAYLTLTPDLALDAARKAEASVQAGDYRGPLHGIPIGLKDIYDTAATPTTAQSRLLPTRQPVEDAFTVTKLKEAGAVVCGKLATFEFAIGGPSFDVLAPPARNPWDLSRSTGGSSSGSGAAVAAGLCLGATGSDTGGSIRNPSAFCGLAGMKPTYGLLSRRGVIPLAQSLDHVGPMCWTSRDAALMLQAMAGHDPLDPACADRPVPDFSQKIGRSLRGLKVGVVRHFYLADHVAEAQVAEAMEGAVEVLRELGCEVTEITLPPLFDYAAVGLVIMSCEAFAIHEQDLRRTPELYGTTCRDRIMLGAFVSGADYVHALRRRAELAHATRAAMAPVDVLVTAGATTVAPDIHASPKWQMYAMPSITMPFNVTGLPALAVCCGFSDEGLPMSMQIVGRAFDEARVLSVGDAYERATSWRNRRPEIALA